MLERQHGMAHHQTHVHAVLPFCYLQLLAPAASTANAGKPTSVRLGPTTATPRAHCCYYTC